MDSIQLLSLKPIIFTQWYHWSNRLAIPLKQRNVPGIYLLARFLESPPNGQADPLCPSIVLIGETRRTLRTRLKDFDNAAFGGRGNHSEGARYRRMHYPNPLDALSVAVSPQSPLDWDYWISNSNEEIARQLSSGREDAVSIEDVIRYKEWFEQEAPAKLKGEMNCAWIKFVERKLLLDYAIQHNHLPECNAV